jgi:hypothetical protein
MTQHRVCLRLHLAKARDLARESADIRARLLEGIFENTRDEAIAASPPSARVTALEVASPSRPATLVPDEVLSAGLLSDLAAVQAAIASLSSSAKPILEVILAAGWEVSADDAALQAAARGALIAPLLDEINQSALDSIGDILVVLEAGTLVLQEDYRDEVYFALRGDLEGFSAAPGSSAPVVPAVNPSSKAQGAEASGPEIGAFGPVEMRALSLIEAGGLDVEAKLTALASENVTTTLLLVDRVNECGLSSTHGDIILDGDAAPPAIIEDARSFVGELLTARARPNVIGSVLDPD